MNFDEVNLLCTLICGAGQPHVWLCHALLVFFLLGSHTPRSLGRSPQNFATWSESLWNCPIRSKNLGFSPKNITVQNMQNFGQFFATSDFDCEYLRNGLRYPNQKGMLSRSIPPAFYETDSVNFGPIISENVRVQLVISDGRFGGLEAPPSPWYPQCRIKTLEALVHSEKWGPLKSSSWVCGCCELPEFGVL